MSKFIVTQSPDNGAWRHYFCGWFGNVPHWDYRREAALKLDETAARKLVDVFDVRYRRVVLHQVEEIS